DDNANNRIDIGDATIIQRLLTGLDPVRAWDVTGNDLNANDKLDSGDVIKVLRAVVGLDPQPSSPGALTGASTKIGGRSANAGPAYEARAFGRRLRSAFIGRRHGLLHRT